jgi:MFS family permease
VLAWALAALLFFHDARNVRDYDALNSALGLRGQAQAPTPLKQMYPSFAADGQTWVRHAISLTEGNGPRLRHTDIDNAPFGREVHWNSAWAWIIAGAGYLYGAAMAVPLPNAIERAAIWLNPATLFVLLVIVSSWARRHLGLTAALLVVAAMSLQARIIEGFFPGYVDHHGLLTTSVFGTILGAAAMMRGVRAGAVFSAACGAFGMWVSAASILPAIFLCAGAGFLLAPRDAESSRAWRMWGAIGAGLSLVFYALEYFPQHVALRLEVNHPLHCIAWLAAGEIVARRGERVARDLAARIWPWLAIAALPATVALGGVAVLSIADPFVANLHSAYIEEFATIATRYRLHPGMSLSVVLIDAIPLAAALGTIAVMRRRSPPQLVFTMLVTAALVAMAAWQSRWTLNAAAGEAVLLIVVVEAWTAGRRIEVRALVAIVAVALVFGPGAFDRYNRTRHSVATRHVETRDAANALARDIAAAIRAWQPEGEVILLASPDASTTIGYYGRFKTLGTLYWENADGLKAAAAIFSARNDDEARRLLRERRVTHIALVPTANFVREYYQLLHPDATAQEIDASFGSRLLAGEDPPAWLQRIPYEVPAELLVVERNVLLFKVR